MSDRIAAMNPAAPQPRLQLRELRLLNEPSPNKLPDIIVPPPRPDIPPGVEVGWLNIPVLLITPQERQILQSTPSVVRAFERRYMKSLIANLSEMEPKIELPDMEEGFPEQYTRDMDKTAKLPIPPFEFIPMFIRAWKKGLSLDDEDVKEYVSEKRIIEYYSHPNYHLLQR